MQETISEQGVNDVQPIENRPLLKYSRRNTKRAVAILGLSFVANYFNAPKIALSCASGLFVDPDRRGDCTSEVTFALNRLGEERGAVAREALDRTTEYWFEGEGYGAGAISDVYRLIVYGDISTAKQFWTIYDDMSRTKELLERNLSGAGKALGGRDGGLVSQSYMNFIEEISTGEYRDEIEKRMSIAIISSLIPPWEYYGKYQKDASERDSAILNARAVTDSIIESLYIGSSNTLFSTVDSANIPEYNKYILKTYLGILLEAQVPPEVRVVILEDLLVNRFERRDYVDLPEFDIEKIRAEASVLVAHLKASEISVPALAAYLVSYARFGPMIGYSYSDFRAVILYEPSASLDDLLVLSEYGSNNTILIDKYFRLIKPLKDTIGKNNIGSSLTFADYLEYYVYFGISSADMTLEEFA